MQKQELLRNAALIDQQKIREQLRSREETLKNDNVAARASNEAELLGYGQGERARERMRELQQIRDSFRQKDADLQSQYQTGDISEDFYRQARAQNAQYLSERLKDQAAFMPNRMRSVRTGRKACRRGSVTGWTMHPITLHRQHSLRRRVSQGW